MNFETKINCEKEAEELKKTYKKLDELKKLLKENFKTQKMLIEKHLNLDLEEIDDAETMEKIEKEMENLNAYTTLVKQAEEIQKEIFKTEKEITKNLKKAVERNRIKMTEEDIKQTLWKFGKEYLTATAKNTASIIYKEIKEWL